MLESVYKDADISRIGGVLIYLSQAIEPVDTTESVTHHPLAGTNLYCLVNKGTCVCEQLSNVVREAERTGLEPATSRLRVLCPNHYATSPSFD